MTYRKRLDETLGKMTHPEQLRGFIRTNFDKVPAGHENAIIQQLEQYLEDTASAFIN